MSSVKDTSEPDLVAYPKNRDRAESRGQASGEDGWEDEKTSLHASLSAPGAAVSGASKQRAQSTGAKSDSASSSDASASSAARQRARSHSGTFTTTPAPLPMGVFGRGSLADPLP